VLRTFLLALLIYLPFFFANSSAQEQNAKFLPQHGRLLIVGQQKNTIEDYLRAVGVVPAGFMVYTSVQTADGLDIPADHGAGTHHAAYFVDRYPGTVLQIGLYMKDALSGVVRGRYDDNIIKIARWLKGTGRPVFLRIGYEFDDPTNEYDPTEYQEAFRYIVAMVRAEGADNIAFVWHSQAAAQPLGNYLDWYPGDDYVDWFAVSYFSRQQTPSVEALSALAWMHSKPLMIAESTPVGMNTLRGRTDWLRQYFDLIRRLDIKVVSYINSRWEDFPMFQGQGWGDARVQADPEVLKLWKEETSSKEFLQFAPDLFDILSFEQKK
jgi:hypothetical protein